MSIKKVLVIDNDKLYVELLSDILSEKGYSVIKAYDGIEALEKAKQEMPFFLIFTDLIMPKVNGTRFCKYIRENPFFDHTFIIVLSGAAIEDRAKLTDIGINAYIPKGSLEEVKRDVLQTLDKLEEKGSLTEVDFVSLNKFQPRPIVGELLLDRKHTEMVIQRMGEGVVEVDIKGRIIWINPAALEIFNKSEGQLIGTQIIDLMAINKDTELKDIINILLTSSSLTQKTATISYGTKTLKFNFTNLIESQACTGFLLLIQDITLLSKHIKKLEEAQAQLFQTAKLSALGQLAANISHEINNPLTNVLGYTSLLLNKLDEESPLKKNLYLIQNESIRARIIIKELLNLVFQTEPKAETIFIDQEIKNTLLLIRNRAETLNIKIIENYQPSIPSIKVNINQFKQVFLNIINNAFDAMPQGGTLSIESLKKGSYLLIQFADTGCGIAPQVLDKLFTPFFTTKKETRGIGLGLSISLGIIKNHGGTIEAKGQLDKGATFTISLPIKIEE